MPVISDLILPTIRWQGQVRVQVEARFEKSLLFGFDYSIAFLTVRELLLLLTDMKY